MKKITRRLTLDKQTILNLSTSQLAGVAGGDGDGTDQTTVLRVSEKCTAWHCGTLVTCPPTGCVFV
jgi:hypothetical protein